MGQSISALDQQLIDAVHRNDIDTVRELVQNPEVNINVRGNYQQTPLFDASDRQTEIVQILLQAGANGNIPNKMGVTPLHVAVVASNFDIVQMLLRRGVDLNLRDKYGLTPLHEADDPDIAKYLIDHGANLELRTYPPVGEYTGKTPLEYIYNEDVKDVIRAEIRAREKKQELGTFLMGTKSPESAIHHAFVQDWKYDKQLFGVIGQFL